VQKPKRDSERLPTRDRIVASAVTLFFERGTFGASMRELADAAEVTVQGLYYHFESKRDLITAVFDNFRAIPGSNPELPEGVKDRIITQAEAEFEVMRENVAFYGIIANEALRQQPDAVEALIQSTKGWIDHWVDPILAGAVDIDPHVDLQAAARVIAAFIQGLNILFVETLDPALKGRIRLLAEFMTPSLLAPAATSP
jgi:AcrR family transcriptional regulator